MAQNSVIVRTCTTQLKNEVFRRGFHFEEKFTKKCKTCGKEHEQAVEQCVECGSMELVKPDKKQLTYAQNFLSHYVNKSNQLFIDVLKEMEDDLNIMDDAYLYLVKEYYIDGNGDIKLQRIKEIYRGDPVTTHIFSDEFGERGNKGFICPVHRDKLIIEPHETCEICNATPRPVHYVNRVHGQEEYYIEGEVVHFSKYSPSRLYGLSPVITLWNHITTLIAMENYVNQSYSKRRMPKGLLAVQTRNIDSMKTFWRAVKEKMEADPHFIPVMGIEAENGKGGVEWIKFMDSLKEMDYTSVKDDLRDRISAFYGVSKIFMADNTTSGGLNNEGMQILVTNRAVEMAQNVYNKYVFPFLTKEFGLTDWELKLPPSEEEDEIANLRKREIEVNIAASIKNLGFEVDMDEKGRFTYKKPEPQEGEEQPKEGEQAEKDPYAGTNIDASQLGQMQEQALEGGKSKPQENPATTRNKPSMSVAPPNRNTGLPKEAANNNVDRRTERRSG
jgi:DNA-directed RNA polymerase subunit RPC12/RpoP